MAETAIVPKSENPHIVILPSPGMGHLIPLVEFSKRLISQHQFSVTLILPTDGPISNSQKIFLSSLPSCMDYHLLPPVNFDNLPLDVKIETRISFTVTRSLPSLREVFKTLVESKKVVAFVVDLFGTDAFNVAIDFNVSPYIFFPSTAMALSLFLYLPKLDATVSCEYRDLPDPIQIPGCIPIHGKDLLDPVQDRKNEAYKWLLHHSKRYRMAEGVVANSFKELEGGAIKALQEEEPGKPPVYPVGPLIQMDSGSKVDGSGCLTWLDEQPLGSVLYISYGSGGTLSHEQLIEVASGLEMSEQRFLWVIRCPNDSVANATYFNVQDSANPLEFLPKGFLERTKGLGLVVPNWAPQAQILSHGSTGGFLTHCGWNSTLESVVHGVPLIAWPLYAEQKMNAVVLTEDIKVALRPKANENGLVGRLEIAKVVKGLMEGEEGKGVRTRMRDLKDAAARVLSQDGSSTKALAELATKLKNKMLNN
ncbi:PREDICTED: hydroquinone glucosyltransferase-like [Nicotiana attenuata]|uniref:Glycosyltransferase n=1 Tax=Nicotiana attenuata TaxID=49451 RepID=A0A2I2MNG4_NICAT|nr:PREDICTED: hydroquinone glucosyltransferase-like [Nicotiana attenuata]AQQ16676.1 UDP-glycosyltransferase g23176 [Nicotiana attenuata]OIT29409.1 udp-glycosyltransferase 72b1 [Nicotiana attenuata]